MNKKTFYAIKGGIARDYRGQVRFVNDFDMTQVKRFYLIKNANTELVRGWRAHRIEQRWFYVISGTFAIDLVKIDDWDNPSQELPIEKCVLKMNVQQVLYVPPGYGTAFQALEKESQLLVFADHVVERAKEDDHTWSLDYFINRVDPY